MAKKILAKLPPPLFEEDDAQHSSTYLAGAPSHLSESKKDGFEQ
jgi:hypothetical protein